MDVVLANVGSGIGSKGYLSITVSGLDVVES